MKKSWKKVINDQIERVKENLKPEALIHDGIEEFTNLIEIFFEYMEEKMHKKIMKKAAKALEKDK